jgi:hypothetical protein
MALGFDANLSGLGFPSATHRRKDGFRIAREWQTFLAARARLTESASELWRRGAFHVEHFGRSGLGRYSRRGTSEQVLNERPFALKTLGLGILSETAIYVNSEADHLWEAGVQRGIPVVFLGLTCPVR